MKILLVTAALFTLSACTTPQVAVKRKWSEAVRNFALTAVYPMREDVYIGTLRLSRINDDDDYTLGSRALGYVDLGNIVVESEARKPTFPKATVTDAKIENEKLKGLIWTQTEQSLATASGGNRLRLAALSAVSLLRLTGAEIGSSSAVGALAGTLSRRASLDIQLLGIETLELDDVNSAAIMRGTVIRVLREKSERGVNWRSGVCVSAATLGVPVDKAQITMITRVFYAHGIEYAYDNNIGAGLSTATPGTALPDAAPSDGAEQQADTEAPTPEVNLSAPGTAIKITARSRDGITQSEVFERPLAFGVSGISVKLSDIGLKCGTEYKELETDAPFGSAKLSPEWLEPRAGLANSVRPVRPVPAQKESNTSRTPLTNANCDGLTTEELERFPECKDTQ